MIVHFRTKIMISYSLLVLILAFVIGIGFGRYNTSNFQKNEYENLKMMTEKISSQLGVSIKQMKFISEYLLSDIEVLDALLTLSTAKQDNPLASSYIKEAKETIQLRLNSYYIIKNFHRVLVYNDFGNVISGENYGTMRINEDVKLNELKWLPKVTNVKGEPILIGIHEDEWAAYDKKKVFSLVREIQGLSMGYIEVQQDADKLVEIFSTSREDIDVIAVQTNGDILYSNIQLDNYQKEYYSNLALDNIRGINKFKNPETKEIEVISSLYSDETKVTVLLVENLATINKAMSYTTLITISITLIILILSLTYIFLLSGVLTKPLRQLTEQMEKTELETLDVKIIYDKSDNNEIESLSNAYQRMTNRLNDAIIKERKQSTLQLQAQYDLLQAQVNPHFIFNVLNVISYRGIKNKDEVICDMCQNLAEMLRYSTNNKERESKIVHEVEYLNRYLYLLKQRYDHKFEYEIYIDDSIKNQIVPKVLIQHIVENSINHGFNDVDKVMKINIEGWREKGWWYISIKDNGQGFSNEAKGNIEKKMKEVRDLLLYGEKNIELEIGGMGLINSYARLLLLYKNDFVFDILSDGKGSNVTIGALIKEEGFY